MGLIRAIAAQCGWWLPRWVIPYMEDEVQSLVEAITLVAAEVAARKAAAAEGQRASQQTRIKLPVGQKPPLPLWGWAAKQTNAGVRGLPARNPEPASPLTQPKRANGFRATCGPPIFTFAKPAPWHAQIVPISKQSQPAATASTMSTRWLSCDIAACGSMTRFV